MDARQRKRLLGLFVAANLLNYMDRYVISAILVPISQDLALTDAQLGRLAFAFLGVYLVAAPIFGMLADRFNRMTLCAVGIALWSVATALGAFAYDYTSLMVTRGLVGVGEAAYATLGTALLADVYAEKDRAKAFTWFFLAIPVGSAIGYGLGGVIGGTLGWRASFLMTGLPGLALAFIMLRTPEPVRGGMEVGAVKGVAPVRVPLKQKLKDIFGNRTWLACTLSYVGYTFAMGSLTHWGPTFMSRRFGTSVAQAGLWFGGMAVITGIFGTFAGGYITDKFQSRFPNTGVTLSIVTLLVAAPVLLLVFSAGTEMAAWAFWFVAMLFLFINTSPVNALTVSSLTPGARALGLAMNIFLIHLLGDAISPEIVGHLSMGKGSTGEALGEALRITFPAVLVAGLALFLALRRRAPVVQNIAA